MLLFDLIFLVALYVIGLTVSLTFTLEDPSHSGCLKISEFNKPSAKMKDPEKVKGIVTQIIKDGASKLQVIADFDRTLLRSHIEGKVCDTTHAIIENSPLISEDIRKEADSLRQKYYPIEIDPILTIEEKLPFLIEWYEKSHNVLLNSGVKKSDFTKMVEVSNATFRDGCDEFFEKLNDLDVPLLIMSAGLGDVLEEVLYFNNVFYPNIRVISNFMEFDNQGNIIGFKGSLIHMFNKHQGNVNNREYSQLVEGRHNIILLGDSLGDLDMHHGLPQINYLLRIGFLNDKIEERLQQFLDGFDVVLIDDQTVNMVTELLRNIH